MEAAHYTRASQGKELRWIEIPNMGHTKSAVTTMPNTLSPDAETYIEYDFETAYEGEAKVLLRFSPTLNFNANKGLRYAVSIDGGEEQIVNLNGHYRGELGRWQAQHYITSETIHVIQAAASSSQTATETLSKCHTLRVRPLDPALVLQKVMIDLGGLKPSYLGPVETRKKLLVSAKYFVSSKKG